MPVGPRLEVASRSTGVGRLVTAAGDIDLASAPKLESELEKHDGVDVVIDLTKVDFMDSSGLVVLIRQQERIRASGAEVTLAVGKGPVTRLIELTGLTETFSIVEPDQPGD